MSQDYEPYGSEWKCEMGKLTKAQIISIAADIGKAYQAAKEQEKRDSGHPEAGTGQSEATKREGKQTNDSKRMDT